MVDALNCTKQPNMKHRLTSSLLLGLSALFTSSLLAQDTSSAFSDATANGDGTFTNWLGTFSPVTADTLQSDIWIHHLEHGTLYLQTSGQDVWLYDGNVDRLGDGFTGYIYTNRELFPFFYVLADTPLWITFLPNVEGPEPTNRVFLNNANNSPLLLSRYSAQDIVGVAVANEFNVLATALTNTDLVGALQQPGPFTVFAPTDAAFGNIEVPSDNAVLANVLTYHVVPGRITSADLGLDAMDAFAGEATTLFATTLNGADIQIDVTPFGVMINGSSMVTAADIQTSNGVIHVIDEVLLPSGNLAEVATAAGFDTLVTAVGAADAAVAAALTGSDPLTVFAPTNEAFANLGETLNTVLLPENQGLLTDILLYHVVPGKVYASEVPLGDVATANTDNITFSQDADGTLRVNGIRIIATNVLADNGVVHVIEEVLLPPSE